MCAQDKYGQQTTGDEWSKIAAFIGTKSYDDVKVRHIRHNSIGYTFVSPRLCVLTVISPVLCLQVHAHHYFVKLQSANRSDDVTVSGVAWTREEDKLFEDALATTVCVYWWMCCV